VIDTNVAVSAVLMPQSIPRQAFDAAVARGRLLISEQTISELSEVLRRPQFNRYISEARRLEFFEALVNVAEAILVTAKVTDCRDPKDNKFLELAVSGSATHIVTGDRDLLVLNPFRGTAIIKPHVFLDEIRQHIPKP
jgi:putative PIN family toxin of toxin-antitoxin system